MAEGCIDALYQGFLECKENMKRFFPDLELKDIIKFDEEGKGEEDGEGEGAEEPSKSILNRLVSKWLWR